DTIGSNSMLADAEIIALTEDIFQKLIGLKFEIRINNRKLLNGILEYIGIKEKDFNSIVVTIDKISKITESEVRQELRKKKLQDKKINELFKILKTKGTNEDILIELKTKINNNSANQGIEELEEVFSYLNLMQVKNFKLDVSLARGLNYYTSIVFEAYLIDSKIKNSVAAGGRYDNMIGNFMESKTQIPAVGISFGLDVIAEAIYDEKNIKKTLTRVYIIPIKTLNQPLALLKKLRENKINSDIDLNERGISKNLDYADKYGIPYVVIIGQEELKQSKFKLRDMKSGQELMLTEIELIEKLK
ncbi:histidine--tRNA ligase family protein, partial [Candidatus Woesearchaeota archaeon]|nr:histidine--tRNA ligase family protein [Candidatus Woesearchaeota archaeon]